MKMQKQPKIAGYLDVIMGMRSHSELDDHSFANHLSPSIMYYDILSLRIREVILSITTVLLT